LVKAGFPVAKVNPRQARRFAEATGKLAKTDSLDAEMLARMGVALAIEPKPGKSDLMLELKELMVARTALIKERTAQRNRSKWHTLDVLKTQMANRLKQIANDLKELDAEIKSRIDNDAVLARHYAILSSIPGFGFVAAIVLLIELPELGTLEAGKVACLAGLAPITRQSGQWRGRAHIYAGRATVRTGLYMPALVATRFNPDMKAKYDSMVKAGKMAKVAITAIMRKMVVLANVLIKEDRLWELKSA
jgi:transposase